MPATALALLLALAAADAVVVVPPEGPGGSPAGWIGAAVAETLPRALQRAGVPAIPGSDRRRAQEALGVPSPGATRATAIRVAESLGASRLVVGSWELRGADLALSLRLLDARRGTLSAPLVVTGPLAEVGRTIHALAWDVALAGPRPPKGTRDGLLRAAGAVPFEALRAFGEGLAARDASALLRQAVEAEPASVDLPFDLGWALLVEGDPAAAAFWLRGAVRRDPGDAQGRLLLSWALSASGPAEEAEEQWRAAAALVPTLEPMRKPDLSRRLERVLPSEQGLLLDPARSGDAEASRAHAARGESLLASADREGAVSELARAALLDPYATRPHLLLGRAHRLQGESEKALAELRMALWCRDDPALRREIAELLRSMGRGEEARRVLGEP